MRRLAFALCVLAGCQQVLGIDELSGPRDASSDGQAGTVTVEARDVGGLPAPGVRVIFADAEGTLVADASTDDNGRATADVGDGGTATLVRPPYVIAGVTQHDVITYADLWSGAHVIARIGGESTSRPVVVRWSPISTTASYSVHVSCVSSSTQTSLDNVVVDVPSDCPRFDVIVLYLESGEPRMAASATAQTGDVVVGSWQSVRTLPVELTGVQPTSTGVSWGSIGVAPFIDRDLPTPPALTTTSVLPDGTSGSPIVVPAGLPLSVQLTPQPPTPNAGFTTFFDEVPADAQRYMRDVNGLFLPRPSQPAFDIATRRMSWTEEALQQPAEPELVFTAVSYMRGGAQFNWGQIAMASRREGDATLRSVAHEDIPGAEPFEPAPAEPIETTLVLLMKPRAEATRAFYEALFATTTALDTSTPRWSPRAMSLVFSQATPP